MSCQIVVAGGATTSKEKILYCSKRAFAARAVNTCIRSSVGGTPGAIVMSASLRAKLYSSTWMRVQSVMSAVQTAASTAANEGSAVVLMPQRTVTREFCVVWARAKKKEAGKMTVQIVVVEGIWGVE